MAAPLVPLPLWVGSSPWSDSAHRKPQNLHRGTHPSTSGLELLVKRGTLPALSPSLLVVMVMAEHGQGSYNLAKAMLWSLQPKPKAWGKSLQL